MKIKAVSGIMLTLLLTSTLSMALNVTLVVAMPLPPSLVLLGAGARWAAGDGNRALYVNWFDNLIAHPNSWSPDPYVWLSERVSVSYTLKRYGFSVEFAADIPVNLSGYDVVVITAYWAVEPRHEPLIRNYTFNGGGVVLYAGVPPHFAEYSKDWWTTTDLSLIQDWFGARRYINTEGYANVIVDNPFGTSLLAGDNLVAGTGPHMAAVTDLLNGAQIMAKWGTGYVFSFTYQYGLGKVYYQAALEAIMPIHANVDINPCTLNLKSEGNWITAYIELPEGYNINDIDIYSIMLNDTFPVSLLVKPPVPVPIEIGDHDNDTIPDLMVKFNRTELTSYIYHTLGIKYGNVTLRITGELSDGTTFKDSDTIKVIFGGDADLNGLIEMPDFYVWRENFGKTPEQCPPHMHPDFDNNEVVELPDFYIWRENFGATTPQQS